MIESINEPLILSRERKTKKTLPFKVILGNYNHIISTVTIRGGPEI